jgi:hypothetical protein
MVAGAAKGGPVINDIVNLLLFRCTHKHLTRPMSPRTKPGSPLGPVHVVCLDCGSEFEYDWVKMRMGKPITNAAPVRVRTNPAEAWAPVNQPGHSPC